MTGKPDDIPQDIWDVAGKACDPYEFNRGYIARALLAERERCAMIAEMHDHRGDIAKAIRGASK